MSLISSHRTPEQRVNLSKSKTGSKNPQWKGDKVGYGCLHKWVKRHLQKPELCQDCSYAKAYDLANISQEYKRDLNDWEWLCRRCHMIKDGRIDNLKPHQFKKKNRLCSVCDNKHYAKNFCLSHYRKERTQNAKTTFMFGM